MSDTMTLSDLKPGDVGVFLLWDGTESEPFEVKDNCKAREAAYIHQIDSVDPYWADWHGAVRYLGRGRIEPARIVMDGEPDLAEQVRTLENWKEQQLAVESEWDAQAVGRLLNVPLGQPIRAAIGPGIESLKEQVRLLRESLENLLRYTISCEGLINASESRQCSEARETLNATKPTKEGES